MNTRVGRDAGLLKYWWHFLLRYGPISFLQAVRGFFERRGRQRRAYTTLLREFPEKLEPGIAGDKAFDRSAAHALNPLFKQLEIEAEPTRVLTLYREHNAIDRYYQFLLDILVLDRSLAAAAGKPELPIIQASKLPPLDRPAPRRNILFVTSQFPSSDNGGGNSLLNFIRLLSRGNDIFLASAFVPGEDQEAYRSLKPFCRSILKLSPWYSGGSQARIRAWLGGRTMDLVHYEWPGSLEKYDKTLGRVQIFTYMEAVSLRVLMDLRGLETYSEAWMQKVAELIPALRLELADSAPLDARVAVTKKDAGFFHKLNPHQEYTVLNHGRNMEEFTLPDVPAEPRTLVFVGNYLHYPNLDAMNWFFREIWPGVVREVPDVHLWLVGTDPPKSLLALTDQTHVTVTGSVPDVRPFIQKAVVCLAPLISGAGIRGKLIEYAALRRTFVATSIAATDLVFEDGRDFLLADEAGEFAEKIVGLLKDPSLAAKMGASAYEIARSNYDAAHLVGFLERIYSRLEAKKATL